jgi:ribosomal protein L7Ae-like RNA K-turn-binding protein
MYTKNSKRSLALTTDKVQRISGMIGFARRAGKTVIGTELVCRAMPKGEVKLVVISSTASDSTKKKLTVKSAFYGISWVLIEIDTERLGALVGKGGAVAAVAITDQMFADEVVKASAQ